MKIIEFKRKGRRPGSPILQYYLVFSVPLRRVMISLHTHRGQRGIIYARLQVDSPYNSIWASGTGKGTTAKEAIQEAFIKAGIEAEVKNPEKALKELAELIGYDNTELINGAYQ